MLFNNFIYSATIFKYKSNLFATKIINSSSNIRLYVNKSNNLNYKNKQ